MKRERERRKGEEKRERERKGKDRGINMRGEVVTEGGKEGRSPLTQKCSLHKNVNLLMTY